MSTETFGRYLVERRLGQGGMAQVFEALDPALDRRVAVKVIYPHLVAEQGFGERFRREAKLVASLRHPHIVQLHDFGMVEDQPFMVMEYLPGGTLKDRLEQLRSQGEGMPLSDVLGLLEAVAAALDYAHARGAVHRDIKPANILFTSSGEPVLTDFGIAKILGESVQVSTSGTLIGTPAYMSPEQAGVRGVSARSDLYSLGVVLYELTTGRVPFRGETVTEVLMQHLHEVPPPPRQGNPNLPEAAEAVILKALAKNPTDRFPSAGEMARAFRAALHGEAVGEASAEASTILAGETRPAAPAALARGAPAALLARLEGPLTQGAAILRRWIWSWQEQGLLPGSILAALGLALALLEATSFGAQLPTWLSRYLPTLAGLAFTGSVLALALSTWRARSLRGKAAGMLAFVAVLGLSWGAWFTWRQVSPPPGFVIAIADFDGSQATRRVDFARRIHEELERELSALEGMVQVRRTYEVYPDSETARLRGRQLPATVLIWGWYDDLGVSPHIEALEAPTLMRESLGLPLMVESASAAEAGAVAGPTDLKLSDLSRFVRLPASMPDFDLFVEFGPQQMTYVSATILGLAFYLEGDPAQALAMFDKALANAPSGDERAGLETVYFYRAAALYQQSRVPEAAADLERSLALKPDLVEAHHNLALAYAELCSPSLQIDRAVAEAETAVRLRPEDASMHLLLGELYRETGRYEEAIAELAAAWQLGPDDPGPGELLAELYALLGKTYLARETRQRTLATREQAVQLETEEPVRARLALGERYLASGRYEEALMQFQAVAEVAPEDPRVHRGLGNVAYWRGDAELAEREYQAWVEAAPQEAVAHLVLGLLYEERGKRSQAVVEVKQAGDLAPCDPAARAVLAGLYWQAGDYAAAASEYEGAATIDPRDADLHYLLGVSRFLEARLGDAEEALKSALDLRPDFVEAHYALGKVTFDQGSFEEAAQHWSQAASLEPQDAAIHVALGYAYERLERWDEATAAYLRALALSADPLTYLSLGQIYYQQGSYGEAASQFELAVRLKPQDPLAYFALGEARLAEGDLAAALSAYQRSLALKEDAGVRSQLATGYLRQGEIDAAIREYEKLVALAPEEPRYRLVLGQLYSQIGTLDQAEEELRAALTLGPESAEAHYTLAVVEYKRCNLSSAVQEANSAVSAASQPTLYQGLLAALYEAQGRSEHATAIYTLLQAAPAADAVAHYLSGSYLLRMALGDEAARELQLVLENPDLLPALASAGHTALGQVYYEQESWLAAESEFQLALSVAPANAEAFLWLGDLALRGGDDQAALAAYDQGLAFLPGYAQMFSGDNAALLAISLHVRRGLALTRQGQQAAAAAAYDRATQLVEDLLARTPQWPLARFQEAQIYAATGEQQNAQAQAALAVQCDQSLAAAWEQLKEELDELR